MIKKGTISHEVLTTVVDNPTDIRELASILGAELPSVRSSIRYMGNKQGVKIQREGDVVWIKAKDMPEFAIYAQEKVYVHILEHGQVTGPEVRKLCGKSTYHIDNIHTIMDRVERDFGVKLQSELIKARGEQVVRVWRLTE